RIITYGAAIVSIKTPDRRGHLDDIVLGFDTLEPYLTRSRFLGTIVGRYGNRIAKGRFILDGRPIQLTVNSNTNHLHGGDRGFDRVVWRPETFARDGAAGVVLTHVSPDGDEGYPGTLNATVTYTLTERNELMLEY